MRVRDSRRGFLVGVKGIRYGIWEFGERINAVG